MDGMAVDVLTGIVIAVPPERVAAYVADPSHAPDWYANIDSVEWLRVSRARSARARRTGRSRVPGRRGCPAP